MRCEVRAEHSKVERVAVVPGHEASSFLLTREKKRKSWKPGGNIRKNRYSTDRRQTAGKKRKQHDTHTHKHAQKLQKKAGEKARERA